MKRKRALRRRYGRAAHGKVDSVTIIGRRWFQRSNGNTYFSSEIIVNGKLVHRIAYDYGYGNMYEQAATEWLIKNGYIDAEKYKSGGYPPMWQLAQKYGFAFQSSVTDVASKKDL
jgi:hypothetical protein